MNEVDYATIEHAEHELVAAQERVRRLKLAALLASGWTQVNVVAFGIRLGDHRVVAYVDPTSKKRVRSVGDAFERLRRRARQACGPTSCERPPLTPPTRSRRRPA